jgi:hypothetical protein
VLQVGYLTGRGNVSFYRGRVLTKINQHFKQINTSTASERNWFLSVKPALPKANKQMTVQWWVL